MNTPSTQIDNSEATDKSLKDAIKKLREAERLLKPSAWSPAANREAKAGRLLDEILNDPGIPGELMVFVKQCKESISYIEISRTNASLSLTSTISTLQAKARTGKHPTRP